MWVATNNPYIVLNGNIRAGQTSDPMSRYAQAGGEEDDDPANGPPSGQVTAVNALPVMKGNAKVGRCRLTLSNHVLTAPWASQRLKLDASIRSTAFKCWFQIQFAPLHQGRVHDEEAVMTVGPRGFTLVHLSAHRERFCGIRWVVSWSFGVTNGSG